MTALCTRNGSVTGLRLSCRCRCCATGKHGSFNSAVVLSRKHRAPDERAAKRWLCGAVLACLWIACIFAYREIPVLPVHSKAGNLRIIAGALCGVNLKRHSANHENRSSRAYVEEEVRRIKALCMSGQLLDAYAATERLHEHLDAIGGSEANWTGSLSKELKTDPILEKLQKRHANLQRYLAILSLASRINVSWIEEEGTELRVGPESRVHVRTRWLDEHERDPSGASAQTVLVMTMSNVRLTLPQMTALLLEMDLNNPECVEHCTSIHGVSGGPEQLYQSYAHVTGHLGLSNVLQITLYNDIIKECTVFRNPHESFNHLGPGVLVSESSVPPGVMHYEGFEIKRGSPGIRMSSNCLIYCTPSREVKGAIDLHYVARTNVPKMLNLLPLRLAAKLLVTMTCDNHIRMQRVSGMFEQLGFAQRIAARRELYGNIEQLQANVTLQKLRSGNQTSTQ
eukprot:TRINITY_DN105547_c0_g1_i1.p1 TRINITY_DN105547_c0_g1~~TRINITY_DN105547_c0_g1_i1.p1  ORF type:complete len:454 (+),score=40.05 TRINITY_DN105547_c0_g1_i1:55-1416(+)